MACTDCSIGLFINSGPNWNLVGSADVTLPNGTVLHRTGPSSIVVSKGGSNEIFSAPGSGGQVHYFNWGTPANFLAILTVEGGAGMGTRTIVIINTGGAALTAAPPITVGAPSTTPLPNIQICPGAGGAVVFVLSDGTTVSPSMWKSDSGAALCSAPGISPSGQILGEVTANLFQIKDGGTVIASCTKPIGRMTISPLTSGKVVLPDAVVGGGASPALATTTRQITISNSGTNCLTINNIGNSAHFSVVPGSSSLPFPVVLDVTHSFTVDISFTAPAVTAPTIFTESLTVTPTPAVAPTTIDCKASARPPLHTISFNSIVFGAVPINSTAVSRNLTINNTGEVPITVSIPSPPTGIAYTWTPPTGAAATIAVGGSITMAIQYMPTSVGPDNRTISFTSNATGSPHSVSVTGSGCQPIPVISLPSTGPVVMGNVQLGFRTVRSFIVRNTGNSNLQFSATIAAAMPGDPSSEADALLFGLLLDASTPVTSPLNTITETIAPVTFCGAGTTGTRESIFGITFFSSGALRTANANLVISSMSGTPATFTVLLSATVVNPVSMDMELVLDRSGSMADPSGPRRKIDVAIDAAKLFVALSRADVGDRIGLVRFDNVPELVLVNGNSIQEVTAANQAAIGNVINPANFSPGNSTCISGGVMVAQKDINTHPRTTVPPELNKTILVLTDGIDNTSYLNPDDGISYSLMGGNGDTALPVPTDMKIYAIGIGNDINVGELGTLSTSTGGQFLHTTDFSGLDYFNLEKYFTQVYMEAVDYATIEDPVFTINPGETHVFDFEVLNGDKSAMVVIYDKDSIRIPFYILSPMNEIFDLTTVPPGFQLRPGISPTARFIEIIMPQGEPDRYSGTWKVILKHDRRACHTKSLREINIKELLIAKDQAAFTFGFQPITCETGYKNPVLYGIAIGAGSNFRMVSNILPGITRVGEPIRLMVTVSEFGIGIGGCKITVKAQQPDKSITYHVMSPDSVSSSTYILTFLNTFSQGGYTFTFTCTGYSRDGRAVKREIVRSKYVQGIDVPNSNGGKINECCKSNLRILRILIILGILIIILLFLLLLRKW